MPGARRTSTSWGWHRLSDEWADRIVAAAGVGAGELVFDIGAGQGALTEHLVTAGARVIAVERHPGRAAFLRRRFADADVRVLEMDAAELWLPRKSFRVVANPPYSITSRLLTSLLARPSGLVAADLVLQRAVVRRLVDGRGGYGHATRRWRIGAGLSLPRHAFQPPPRVDSAVAVIRRR